MSDKLRSLMPGLKNKLYFNYGGQGPLPSPSLNEITRSWQKIQELGPFTSNVSVSYTHLTLPTILLV